MEAADYKPGDVLLLEHAIAGIPWPTGCFVLCSRTEASATVALVSEDAEGLYAIDNPYPISAEDLASFTPTGVQARTRK